MRNWRNDLEDFDQGKPTNPFAQGLLQSANREMVRNTMLGFGPDARRPDPEAGQRLVYNVSSAHVGSVLDAKYLNGYDLKAILGTRGVSRLRRQVDEVVAALAGKGQTPETTYYGEVELNGSGIRYFGDFCLVLKPIPDRADLLLFTNSYDVHRQPARASAFVAGDAASTRQNRRAVLETWAGHWPADAPDMAVLKLAPAIAATRRRLTVSRIAASILVDEDYIEVPRHGSFGAADIEEIRISAADAAAEARIADRLNAGPTPSLSELQWRHRRRAVESAALAKGLTVRVVVTLGRDRG